MSPNPVIEILGEFGAGYGDTSNLAVRFLLAGFFWAVLLVLALQQGRHLREPRDRWVALAALLGLVRELWMFVMEYGAKQGYLPHDFTHTVYPPLEHLLSQLSYVAIGTAFVAYFLGPGRRLVHYLQLNGTLTVVAYAVVQATWPPFLRQHPELKFGDYPGDVWIHVLMAWLVIPVLIWLVRGRREGTRVPWALVAGFGFFLLDDLLMIVHLGFGQVYPELIAPLRHNLHIWAIPWFIGVYWGEQQRRALHERQKSESIIAAIGDGISIHAPDLKVTYQNRAHRDMVGDMVGEYCYRVYRHRDQICEDCPVQAAMADKSVHTAERTYRRTGKVLGVTASPLCDADGNVIAGVEVVRDLTEHRVLEQRTAESQKLEAVGRLAGGVAHDFNNLLTVILGRTELLLAKGGQPEHGRRGLQEIHRVAERAAALTQQLLAFGKRQPCKPEVVDLNQILDQTEPILRRLIPENIRLEITRALELDPVLADPSQAEQVVVNLAVNARDAMPAGGTLRIRTGNEEVIRPRPGRHGSLEPGRYAVLTVEDSGEGMDDEVLKHLFEPFFTTKEDRRGTGLGLATVFGVLEQSRGHIEVDSTPSRGSTFRVYLPRSTADPEEVRPRSAPREEDPGGQTVLVVEDEDSVRELVAGILSDAGYNVLSAGRGRDAVNQAERHAGPIHLLLTDVIMPEMGGPELARELAQHRPDTRVLYMSGYTDDHLTGSGADPDEIEILSKPFTARELVERVSRVLRRQAA